MHRRNALSLLIVLAGAVSLMLVVRFLLWPGLAGFGIAGTGTVGLVLMAFNRRWLYPSAPQMPLRAIALSAVVAMFVSIALTVVFAGLAA